MKNISSDFFAMKSNVIQVIHSPLGFFVLALTVVEGFLLGAGIFFGLPLELKIKAIEGGVILFLIVFGTVVWLVVKHPQKLVFSEESYVQFAKIQKFGTESNLMDMETVEKLLSQSTSIPPTDQLIDSNGENN